MKKYPETWMISISGNKTSYENRKRVLSTWKEKNIDVHHWEATTPDDFHMRKYEDLLDRLLIKMPTSDKVQWREFTDTEKAVWASHWSLWKYSLESNSSVLVIEHDTELMEEIDPNLIKNNKMVCMCSKYEKHSDNKIKRILKIQAAGAYYITPEASKTLLEKLPKNINLNVDAHIHEICAHIGWFEPKLCRTVDYYTDKTGKNLTTTIEHPSKYKEF